MQPTLHIVNGASVAGNLRTTGIFDIAYWHEALYMGPLKATDDAAFTSMRKDYWLSRQPWPPDWVLMNEKEQRLFPNITQLIPELKNYSSIILWFEFDLYDQTMLWYILRQFHLHPDQLPQLFLISPDTFPGIPDFHGLGQLHPEQLQQLIGTEKAVIQEEITAAIEAWEAYASGNEEKMIALIENQSPLPYLKRALTAHLEQFPQVPTMLGKIQLLMLHTINHLESPLVWRVVGEAMACSNPDYGLSDTAALDLLVRMSEDARGLIEFTHDGETVEWDFEKVKETRVVVTENGKHLLTL